MSQFRTQADLVNRVLEILGPKATGQDAAAEDVALVTEDLPSIFATLGSLFGVYINDPDNIPITWFLPVADIVAFSCAPKFGVTGDELGPIAAAGSIDPQNNGTAVKQLQVIARGRATFEAQRSLYF